MSVITVSNAQQLSAAIASSKAGDTIQLNAGNYGDLTVLNRSFATDLTIKSADASHPAVFNTLTVTNSSGIDFVNLNVNMTATSTTTTASSAVRLNNSSNIEFEGGSVKAGLAINGVAPTATALDSTGNVIGMPTGRGFTIINSSHVTIDHTDISQVFHGMVLADSHDLSITNNNIHNVRTSPISGGDVSNVVIDGNHLSDSNPFRWGSVDHADFIHLWTDPNHQTTASTNIQITNNTLAQGSGTAILGIYLDDNNNHLGFSGVNIADNLIMNGNGQGMRRHRAGRTVQLLDE
jgi:hypothetical protein